MLAPNTEEQPGSASVTELNEFLSSSAEVEHAGSDVDVSEESDFVCDLSASSRLESTFKAMQSLNDDEFDATVFFHEGSDYVLLENLRSQLAVIPEFEEAVEVDIDAAHVGTDGVTTDPQKVQMKGVIRPHKSIFQGGGNALPPPIRGVVCDIDVGDAQPIADRARRIPIEQLVKVYELLKKLLDAGLIRYSSSPWASPIVIVMKKNGEDIRLCIDYRRVNLLIKLMNYPLPVIDELLENFDKIMWYCSLDAASGFWAVLMTARASLISAFICPLGHFEWIRMPFGLKNAPLIYQMIINNCLWGFVRLPPGLEAEVEPEVLEHFGITLPDVIEPVKSVVNGGPTVFDLGIPSPKSMGPIVGRSSYIDDIGFGAVTWDELCKLVDELLFRLRYWRISISLAKSTFGTTSIAYLSHDISRDGMRPLSKLAKSLKELPFPSSLKGVQSFLGSLNYYHKFIEDYSVVASSLYELSDDQVRGGYDLDKAKKAFGILKGKMLQAPILRHPRPADPLTIIVHANDWAISAVLCQEFDGVLHPVRYTGRVLQDSELNYHITEKEVLAVLRVLTTFYTLVVGKPLVIYTRYSILKWLMTSRTLQGRCLQWATLLSPWSFEVRRIEKDEDGLAALLAASITPREHLDEVAEDLAPNKLSKKPLRPPTLAIEMMDPAFKGHVMTFDGAARLKTKVGSAGFVIWQVPEWEVVTAQGEFLENVTVNEAEYRGMLAGMEQALAMEIHELVVVGDSRIAIQQAQGVIACAQPHLQLLLEQFRKLAAGFTKLQLFHVKREFNSSADYLTVRTLRLGHSETLTELIEIEQLKAVNKLPERFGMPVSAESSTVQNVFAVWTRRSARAADPSLPLVAAEGGGANDVHAEGEDRQAAANFRANTTAADLEAARQERYRRIATHQDLDPWPKTMKQFLRGELDEIPAGTARSLAKVADQYVINDDEVLCYLPYPSKRRPEGRTVSRRMVVPASMRSDVLHECHSDFQGGHQGISRTYERVSQQFHWMGMYKDVERHVKNCPDCESGRGRPPNPGSSPGNIVAEYPFHIVSMDFVKPLPETNNGNTALLLFQCMFSGFVLCKAMRDTTAQDVAEAYEEVVFRRFGASAMIRHDQEPSFMSEVFRAFRRMMGSRQRATLAYRPQANGQQERSVQTMVRSIKAYVEDPAQGDWDEICERLMFAINTSYDFTRKETPFFLVHGWDAQSTMAAMLGPAPRRINLRDAYKWRLQVQRQVEYVRSWAKDLQVEAKQRRADDQNRRVEELPTTVPREFEIGEAVWLYIARVKPGLTRKLAHMWHGPFRIVEKGEDFRYKLKLEGSAYRFYPWVHISRLKPRVRHPERPTAAPAGVDPDDDFDAALLPEDSWEPDNEAGEFEVAEVLDARWVKRTRTSKRTREYLVRWAGYEEPSWEPVAQLNCGALLYEFERRARSLTRFDAMQTAEGEPDGEE